MLSTSKVLTSHALAVFSFLSWVSEGSDILFSASLGG